MGGWRWPCWWLNSMLRLSLSPVGNMTNISLMRTTLVQRPIPSYRDKIDEPQNVYSLTFTTYAEATCFPSFPLLNKHAKNAHTYQTHTPVQQQLQQLQWGAITGHVFIRLILWAGGFTGGGEKNSKTELMCVFVLHGRGEPFFSPSTNRKTLAAFSQDRRRQWQRERSQSDIDLNQTNPPLVPMWP